MQFLIETSRDPAGPDEAFARGLVAEESRLRELYAGEVVRQIWHRTDRPGAVILVEAGDAEQALQSIGSLPLVGANLVKIDTVIPLKPYAGFARR